MSENRLIDVLEQTRINDQRARGSDCWNSSYWVSRLSLRLFRP